MAKSDQLLQPGVAEAIRPPGGTLRVIPWWKHILGTKVAPYLFVSPFFLLFAAFWVFSVFWSIILSCQHWTAQSVTWVGLANFRFVIDQPAV